MATELMVKAIKRGTLTHATGNYHFDPEGFPAARKRGVPAAVAGAAAAKGLVQILKTRVVTDDVGDTSLDARAAEREKRQAERLGGREMELADILGAGGPGSTIATTHTQTDRTITANTGGATVTDISGNGQDDDDDEGERRDDGDDLGEGVDRGSGAGDAPPAGEDETDQPGTASSSRARRAAARARSQAAQDA